MTRKETDLLGELSLPDDALYGIQTQRAVNNFPVSGQPVHNRLIRAGAMVKLACAKANLECGYLDATIAKVDVLQFHRQ